MSRVRAYTQAIRLALADFLHDWRVSACLVLGLAAVMTPLLVLFGLKTGIVSTLQQRLLADPRNLEVVIVGSYRLDAAWFEATGKLPLTAFVVPRTRSLAATMDVRAANGAALPGLEMVPTAAGDPLLPAGLAPPQAGQVLLTRPAATVLKAEPGTALTAQFARTVNGETQVARTALTVAGIVPETAFGRAAAFVPLDLLLASEDFRDGRAAPLLGAAGTPPEAVRTYAGARLFARDLNAVAPLAERLRGEGMEIRTRAADIAAVQAIDRVLTLIFTVIAAIGAGGFLLSLGASLWAGVERKRRELALLRLIGFPGGAAAAFPAAQGLFVAAGGIALSSGLYLGVAAVFDAALGANLKDTEFVCRLLPGDFLLGAAATLAASLLAALVAGLRAARVEPAESLRDV